MIHRLAARLDSWARGWWLSRVHPATIASILSRAGAPPLDATERIACGLEPLDVHTAEEIVRCWEREAEARRDRAAGRLLATVGEAGPARDAHVRIQTSDPAIASGTASVLDGALWLRCDHCGTTRHSRAATRGQLRREGHDFMLKHKLCIKPKEAVQ